MKNNLKFYSLLTVFFISIVLSSCSGQGKNNAAVNATQAFNNALLTATYAIAMQDPGQNEAQATNTLEPTIAVTNTETPIPATPTIVRTPPNLPQPFTTDFLNQYDTPHTYIADTCQYLKSKWDPNNSTPGTVVMPIMFHSIVDGAATEDNQVSHDDAVQLLRDLKDQGFEAISMEQLKNFLQNNAKIPQRSVILIVDDRHYAGYYETHFKPSLDEFGWSVVVNAWISTPKSTEDLVAENVRLAQEGWVDYQGHGVHHNIPISNWATNTLISTDTYGDITSQEYIHNELFGASNYIETTFGKKPIAYIWPGGGFSQEAIDVAGEAGYSLGFTVNPRGPVMFNWIPLADSADSARPSYMPEGTLSNPLMVLPRYWDTDARYHIDEVRQISKAAAQYASDNVQTELEYYDIVCRGITGEIPALAE